MAMAARLPMTPGELGRIRGVPKRWCAKHGERAVTLIREAVQTTQDSGFVALAPPPYATFFDYRFDAWLETMRAEVCEQLQAAPDLLLPKRLLHRIGQAVASGAPLDGPGGIVTGWRAELLAPALRRHIEQHPPPRKTQG